MESFSDQDATSSKVKMSKYCSPFDLLPNEMVSKIVKMFFNSENGSNLFSGCICKDIHTFAPGAGGVRRLTRIAPGTLAGHVVVTIKTDLNDVKNGTFENIGLAL